MFFTAIYSLGCFEHLVKCSVFLHLAEKHFPENHMPKKHFPERLFSRISIFQKSHLPEVTSARMNVLLYEILFIRKLIFQKLHLPEFTFS